MLVYVASVGGDEVGSSLSLTGAVARLSAASGRPFSSLSTKQDGDIWTVDGPYGMPVGSVTVSVGSEQIEGSA